MKYKIGDKVRIVKEKTGAFWDVSEVVDKWLGKTMTIKKAYSDRYEMQEDDCNLWWYDHMIEGLVSIAPRKLRDAQPGDIIVNERGLERTVFLIDEYVAILSAPYNYSDFGWIATWERLEKDGYKLKDQEEEQVEELTMEQVCEELGRTVKIIK